MATTENKTSRQVVEDFLETFSTGNVENILDSMTDDATWWVAGTMEGISGTYDKQQFGELTGGIAAGAKTGAITLTPHAWTVDGDRVAVETESYCELNNGRVYNNLYHFLFVVKDGKIQRVKEFLDTEHTVAVFLTP
ncbi:nuclear transport factor 2 family protein [Patulibacter sp.]|uniref:nuclear transport factor 2 family protein n=1 Tax=Patulibacter sp. TaxID=1912859 RepID=UPI00271FF92E|nr:nuclear transport factor 2 family protein [Patulibacter sp.]MDO9410840.1 nuclear transport factor 2 family protein [Patulibacter sp.]